MTQPHPMTQPHDSSGIVGKNLSIFLIFIHLKFDVFCVCAREDVPTSIVLLSL